jgi:hypothetical protein
MINTSIAVPASKGEKDKTNANDSILAQSQVRVEMKGHQT